MPRFCFVNKLDRTGADFWRVVDMIRERLGATAVPVQLPIGTEGGFRGVIDLLEMKAITYGNDLGDLVEVGEIPAELAEEAATWRDKLVEAVADLDDDIAHRFLGGAGGRRRRAAARPARGHAGIEDHPGPVRLGPQEQGRAADARRGDRVPPLAARRGGR